MRLPARTVRADQQGQEPLPEPLLLIGGRLREAGGTQLALKIFDPSEHPPTDLAQLRCTADLAQLRCTADLAQLRYGWPRSAPVRPASGARCSTARGPVARGSTARGSGPGESGDDADIPGPLSLGG
ncbi:hypothetical protein LDL08_05255 [Nonomuraea glycinis]|uniref:Uncharacterized protein n=1 Tax=Nonomuraea glycinis TaxID=2047744 RepID=A0A918A5U1_9ACTN|nr:hypothetical protein [Nonomuraea glycinis]MCA2175588.1 hypothetical protein [Nonomuraea glycinis]GGP04978.1 hypothetical protein GCM10012278_22550 [Nonomuraea glycinis]